jgi:hypothetical protein
MITVQVQGGGLWVIGYHIIEVGEHGQPASPIYDLSS